MHIWKGEKKQIQFKEKISSIFYFVTLLSGKESNVSNRYIDLRNM